MMKQYVNHKLKSIGDDQSLQRKIKSHYLHVHVQSKNAAAML